MKIILLGTGTPTYDPARQQSALLINLSGEKLLFDAGCGATSQLAKAGFQPEQVDKIFITHHHLDHIGGLGELFLSAWQNGREKPLNIYGPPGTQEIVAALLDRVYARDIAFTTFIVPEMVNIHSLIQVNEVSTGLACRTRTWKVIAEQVDHGNSLGLTRQEWPCLGFRLETEGKVITISGDTAACKGLDRLAQDADILIQCCYLAEAEISTPFAERQAMHIIASSGQVGKIAARNRVKKLILTHIRTKPAALMLSLVKDIRENYTGDLLVGEDLLTLDI
jgi:ribonuclease BN (tRNA processing enzyme)